MSNLTSRLQNESLKLKPEMARNHDANVAEYKRKGKGKVVPNKPTPPKIPPQSSTPFKKLAKPKKFEGKFTYYHKKGHMVFECRKKAKMEANLTEADMCAVVTEANVVESNPKEWWYDTGVTTHICLDKNMFCSYSKNKTDTQLRMGNVSRSKIEGTGKVVLKMTSGKELTLNNVKHVPDMRKNLISGTTLNKHGFAISFESDKLVLKKHGVIVGRGYEKE